MKKVTLLFVGMLAWSAMPIHAQITKPTLWAPTSDATQAFLYGGNYKNTVQAGVTITVLDNGYPDKSKPTPVFPTDYKYPHWDLAWHFNNLTDNKNNLDPLDDIPTNYLKISNIAYTDTLFWVANATDPYVPFAKTVAASHLPTRNGIFFAGVDANEGKHALGVFSMWNIKDSKFENKDWCRLQSYQSGGNAVLVDQVSEFLNLLNWGKVIKERARSGAGTLADPYKYFESFNAVNVAVPDSSCVFAMKVGENDNALAFYPGKYDKTNVRLAFQFDSSRVSSDISFKLMQVSKGTSGKNMTYKMIVSLVGPDQGGFINLGAKLVVSPTGCDKTDDTSLGEVGPVRYVIDNIFESQGGANDMTTATVINVAEKIKTVKPEFTIEDFSKKRIIVSIIGEATEPAAAGTHHPIIAMDDIHVSYWIDWYKHLNSGLTTSVVNPTLSSTKVIGLTGQIQITGAQAQGTVYTVTGQNVASFVRGDQVVPVPAGIYLVKERNQPVVKVYVK